MHFDCKKKIPAIGGFSPALKCRAPTVPRKHLAFGDESKININLLEELQIFHCRNLRFISRSGDISRAVDGDVADLLPVVPAVLRVICRLRLVIHTEGVFPRF